jgi:hypothetical protein
MRGHCRGGPGKDAAAQAAGGRPPPPPHLSISAAKAISKGSVTQTQTGQSKVKKPPTGDANGLPILGGIEAVT